ncbi:MAG: VWA domain-containing protein [Deltaproteobacteria bacterium]|nr:VWA domain-containing protein [Deltaproteobacteria bacterium]
MINRALFLILLSACVAPSAEPQADPALGPTQQAGQCEAHTDCGSADVCKYGKCTKPGICASVTDCPANWSCLSRKCVDIPPACTANDARPECKETTEPDTDEDGDTISDKDEGTIDTDGDGLADYQDTDSDDDGISDAKEAGDSRTQTSPIDTDFDGTPDFRDLDADGNGRTDKVDGTGDFDGDGIFDAADLDDDGDTIDDTLEMGIPASPRDTDGDKVPDFRDKDSDGDSISDLEEGGQDTDHDMTMNALDLDSDGDCRSDAMEAGDAVLTTPPRDFDGDKRPDYLDTDSDNDGLGDSVEDKNCNGIAEASETSAANADSDSDGATDLVEVAAGTDPHQASDNPRAKGDFVFVVPFNAPPSPTGDTLGFSTTISRADAVFVMDTTASMSGAISNLKTSLNTIVSSLSSQIANMGFGVGGYDDIPWGSWGSPGDMPWYLLHRVMTTKTPAGLASVQAGVNALALHSGGDGPESGWEAMYQVASGAGLSIPSVVTVPPFSAATAPPLSIAATEQVGTLGGVGFRGGSLPIVVWITDADSHNGEPSTVYSYTQAATRAGAMAALTSKRIRVIGVMTSTNAKKDLDIAVSGTNAVVTPSAWGPVGGGRPATCAATQCCTGASDAGVAPDANGKCPLLFTVGSNGSGLGSAIVKAIEVLTTFGIIDISAKVNDDPSDAVNTASFIARMPVNVGGGACTVLPAVDTNGDGHKDTFTAVQPGNSVCFDVVPAVNTIVAPIATPQIFRATISVVADGVSELDARNVFFLVPPKLAGD